MLIANINFCIQSHYSFFFLSQRIASLWRFSTLADYDRIFFFDFPFFYIWWQFYVSPNKDIFFYSEWAHLLEKLKPVFRLFQQLCLSIRKLDVILFQKKKQIPKITFNISALISVLSLYLAELFRKTTRLIQFKQNNFYLQLVTNLIVDETWSVDCSKHRTAVFVCTNTSEFQRT